VGRTEVAQPAMPSSTWPHPGFIVPAIQQRIQLSGYKALRVSGARKYRAPDGLGDCQGPAVRRSLYSKGFTFPQECIEETIYRKLAARHAHQRKRGLWRMLCFLQRTKALQKLVSACSGAVLHCSCKFGAGGRVCCAVVQ
jgi:hypothetical protein